MSDKRYMAWEDETAEDRARSVRRGYRDALLPSAEAQERYPVSEFPCPRCEGGELPSLADHGGTEFYWEHREGRDGCTRFGSTERGDHPRAGTATSLWVLLRTGVLPWEEGVRSRTRARTPEQYQRALASGMADGPEAMRRHAEEGHTAAELAEVFGYDLAEMETLLAYEKAVHDHYSHPNWNDDEAHRAAVRGERYDPAEGWEG